MYSFYIRTCVERLDLGSQVYANLQQRDNQLNHRYGADMRLITAITLIFLPGTFVATFFSTTFWDFSPDNEGAKVSNWVYLYFVVTVGLTLLVLVVWRKFSALRRFTMEMVQLGRRVPLLRRLIREKKTDDEESGKKCD
jgi:Mg2+ and Co2+ transporter CorA